MKKKSENRVECDFDHPPKNAEVCKINVDVGEVCVGKNNYTYHKGSPCVFLKLNKVSCYFFFLVCEVT